MEPLNLPLHSNPLPSLHVLCWLVIHPFCHIGLSPGHNNAIQWCKVCGLTNVYKMWVAFQETRLIFSSNETGYIPPENFTNVFHLGEVSLERSCRHWNGQTDSGQLVKIGKYHAQHLICNQIFISCKAVLSWGVFFLLVVNERFATKFELLTI